MVEFDSKGLKALETIGTGRFDFERAVSGKSLVTRTSEKIDERSADRSWPCSMAEHLRGLAGSFVRVEYSAPNGQRMMAGGKLKTVGTDFLALRLQSGEELLIGFGSIAGIKTPGGV